MHPELFEIPVLHLPIRGFGLMMGLGFLVGFLLIRRLARCAGLDREILMNAALYCLIAGVVGARVFFVLHRYDQFRHDLFGAIAVWRGGLEFVGGVIPATIVLLVYLRFRSQPIRRYIDLMAIGLMMGLAFGRVGCFLNGCCFGRPCELPWAVRFPYRSFVCISQINPNPARGRAEPQLDLPKNPYLDFYDRDGNWYPKPLEELSEEQRHEVTEGKYRCLPVHPTQLYSSGNALLICLILYLFWRKTLPDASSRLPRRLVLPGSVTAMAFVLYGVGRFILESIRDDNPYEFANLTVSQITAIGMIVLGVVILVILPRLKPCMHSIPVIRKDGE